MRGLGAVAIGVLGLGVALALTPAPAAGMKKGPSVQELPETLSVMSARRCSRAR